MKCSIVVKCHLIYEEKTQHNPPNSLLDIFHLVHPDACILNEEAVLNRCRSVSRLLANKNKTSKNTNTKTLDM